MLPDVCANFVEILNHSVELLVQTFDLRQHRLPDWSGLTESSISSVFKRGESFVKPSEPLFDDSKSLFDGREPLFNVAEALVQSGQVYTYGSELGVDSRKFTEDTLLERSLSR